MKQTFINNGYPNKLFYSIIQNYLNKKCAVSSKNIAQPNTHNIYYQNQFSNCYKTEERIIKQIAKDNTKCVNESDLLKITIYYKSHTISNLISKNNLSHKSNQPKQANIVYKYTCNVGDCELQSSTYIGMTTTILPRRLTMHLAAVGHIIHMQNDHNCPRKLAYLPLLK